MENLENIILEYLKKKSNIDIKGIKRDLKFSDDELKKLEDCILSLEKKGKIYINKDGKISLLENKKFIYQGVIHILPDEKIIVTTENNLNIILTDKKKVGILNKDIVTVKNVYKGNDGKYYGQLDKIIERRQEQVVCEVVFIDGKNKLIPYNSKNKTYINIDQKILDEFGDGQLLLIKLEKNGFYDGKLIKEIGHKNEPDIDEKSIAYDYGFEIEYSNKYLKELEKIPSIVNLESAKKNRVDLTDKNIFTIDSSDTKDIDDSIGIELLPNGNYKLYISIADVAYYIKDNTEICNEAYRRGTSVYMNDTVIPMLHPKISNGICSLHPNVNRLTKTCEIILSPDGEVLNYDIYDSIINSKKKMNYDNVNKILMNNESVDGYEDFYDDLKLMNELSKKLDIIKTNRGYINFSKEDIKVSGKNENINFSSRKLNDAEFLIENFMLLANECVASHIYYRGLPFIYRIHEAPDEEKIESYIKELNELGYNFKNCKKITTNKYIQNIADKLLENSDDIKSQALLENLLTSMKRAKYSNLNIGHFGLALKNYTHFTSPIRRYADLQVHKLLDLYNKCPELYYGQLDDYLREVANNCTKKSIAADKAEIEAKKMRMAEYMESRIGEQFTGFITNIGQNNISLKLENGISGILNYDDLDENFSFDKKRNCLVDNLGNTYTIGSEMDLIVKSASKKKRTICFKGINRKKEKKKVYKKNKK